MLWLLLLLLLPLPMKKSLLGRTCRRTIRGDLVNAILLAAGSTKAAQHLVRQSKPKAASELVVKGANCIAAIVGRRKVSWRYDTTDHRDDTS
jgi:hypothetical protein